MEDTETQVHGDDTAGLSQSWPAAVEAMLVPMYRFISARAPAAAVDDLVQETFVAASRGIGRFDDRCPLWNWLTAIARNKIADYYRRSGTRSAIKESLEGLNCDSDHVQQALLSESPLPDEICERREFQALARAALGTLAPEQQDYLACRYDEGLSLNEISQRFGTSPSLTNTRLHRARQALKQAFLTLLRDKGNDQESLL